MPILETDIKILASQVLADVPEGGGSATGNEIVDGVSNNLFPDVSDLDGIYGDVGMRKIFPAVRSPDRDAYLGAHLIVANQPADTRVSALIMTTNDPHDTRDAAKNRIEAYLSIGPLFTGLLFGNHIAGMRTITMLCEESVPVPADGTSFVLNRHDANGPSSFQQYVRITGASSRLVTFTDDDGQFTRLQIDFELSDMLRHDFSGFEAQRKNVGLNFIGKGRLHTSIVADAARYYSASKLAVAATLNDFAVTAESIYAQLVPSAQTETAIVDARMNQRQVSVVANGGKVSRGILINLTPTQRMFIGSGVMPGTFMLSGAGVTLTDRDGFLVNLSDNVVGAIDYTNGILSLSSPLGLGGVNGTIEYTAAVTPDVVTESLGRKVTEQNRALTWVVTLDPAPAKGSVEVHYMAQGQWYVLRDGGSGGLRGEDSAFGAGAVNFATGSVAVTLGALPDVGSVILFLYNRGPVVTITDNPIALNSVTQMFFYAAANRTFEIGSVQTSIVGDPSFGVGASGNTDAALITGGEFRGNVRHHQGQVNVGFNTLPPHGASVRIDATVSADTKDTHGTTVELTDGGSVWNCTVAGGFNAGSLSGSVAYSYDTVGYPGGQVTKTGVANFEMREDGLLVTTSAFGPDVPAGTVIGYANGGTGVVSFNKAAGTITVKRPIYRTYHAAATVNGPTAGGVVLVGYENASVPLTITASIVGQATKSAYLAYTQVIPSEPWTISYQIGDLTLNTSTPSGKMIAPGTSFRMGGSTYVVNEDGDLVRDINPLTGVGTPAGTTLGAKISVTSWTAGSSPEVTDFKGQYYTPPAANERDDYIDTAVFRTATAPIRPESFNVSGEWADGVTFSVFADANGRIQSATQPEGSTAGTRGVLGEVDSQTGLVTLRFGALINADTPPEVNDPTPGTIAWNHILNPGQAIRSKGVKADTLRYNASGYSYIPLETEIIGIDPVRLPSDGKVPVFRKGSVVVVHHTDTTAPVTVANGDTIDCGRNRIARARLIGSDGETISTGYTADLDAGTLTFTDVTGYVQPVRVEHRIEDGALVTDAQINGRLALARPLTHDFPLGSWVSSALLIGDLQARVSTVFDQVTWTNEWSDTRIGTDTLANFDSVNYPIEVTNDGAITQRWALVFTNTTSFNIIGESLGLIGSGTTNTVTAPLNPSTGVPYFTINPAAFGGGWATGNVLRHTTIAADGNVWVVRTIKPGPRETDDDRFTLILRGGIDA